MGYVGFRKLGEIDSVGQFLPQVEDGAEKIGQGFMFQKAWVLWQTHHKIPLIHQETAQRLEPDPANIYIETYLPQGHEPFQILLTEARQGRGTRHAGWTYVAQLSLHFKAPK